MVLIRQSTEVAVDPRDQFIGHELPVSAAPRTATEAAPRPPGAGARQECRWCSAGGSRTRSRATPTRASDDAGFRNHDHGFDFTRSKQVVENQIGPAHLKPDSFVFAATVLQIHNWIAGLEVRLVVISRRRIDENVAPCMDRLGKVVRGLQVAVRYVLDVVPVHASLGNFKAVAHVAVAHEGLGSGVQYDGAIDEHPVVVIAGTLRNARVGPYTIGAFDHVVRKRAKRTLAGGDQGNLDLLRVGSGEVERDAIVFFNPRILRAIDIVRVRM